MLSREDNEALTRIGPGTVMGDLFRQYWLPALMSSELPDPDGPPKRLRMLGEDLIAFRNTSGKVGLLANNCSHRGASLFFGRNEEDGLRCVYHGWKYDVDGRCIDMPNEPPESSFCDKVRHTAYPCREINGSIWTYMGPRTEPPPFPDLEWTQVPERHCARDKTLRECNWMQAMEGDIDNAHVPFLHSQLSGRPEDLASQIMMGQRVIHLEIVARDYGVMYAVRREAGEGQYNWRIIQFLFPCFSMFTSGERGVVPAHLWIPVDDENTMVWNVRWNPTGPISGWTDASSGYLPNTSDWLGQWRLVANKTNDYLIDREAQRKVSFSGLAGFLLQDQAVTESMGVVADRTREHLGTTDAMIMRVRKLLLDAATALRDEGVTPPCVDEPRLYRVRSAIVNLPREANWVEATRETVKAFTGLPAASIGW